MGFIYENAEEYAKTCQCDLEIARKRCNYFLHLHQLMEQVHCPECKAEYHLLVFDDEGNDFSPKTFISCTNCWEGFETDDDRLKNWVNYHDQFDEVLSLSLSHDEEFTQENWTDFVQKSTEQLIA